MRRRPAALGKPEGAFHHGNLAEALLARSLEVLDAEGLAAIGVRPSPRAPRADPAAVYRHYRDLDALLGAVARAAFVELAVATERGVERAGDAEAAFRAAGEAYVAYALRYPARFQAMFGARGSGPDAWPRDAGRAPSGRTAWETFEATVERMHAEAPLRAPPKVAAKAAWASVHGLSTLLIEGPLRALGPAARRALVETTLEMTIAGPRAAMAPAPAPRARGARSR